MQKIDGRCSHRPAGGVVVVKTNPKMTGHRPVATTSVKPLPVARDHASIKSGALLRSTHIFALCFELRELLTGKNSFRVGQECFTALFCAACLHAFGLPRLDPILLIRREIQCSQINARHRVRIRRAVGATSVISCECAGCSKHRSRN